MALLTRLRNIAILPRLLFAFLSVGLLPLVVVTLILLNTSQQLIQEEVQRKLRAIADGKISQIETYALERSRDALALSKVPTIINGIRNFDTVLATEGTQSPAYSDVERDVRALVRFILEGSGYGNLMLFASDGTLLFSVVPSNDIGINLTQRDPNNPLVQTLNNARTILETEISRTVPQETPVSYISAPVLAEGVVVGMVTIELDKRDLYSVVSDRTGLSLGETGEAVVGFADSGQMLFSAPTYYNPNAAFTPIGANNSEAARPLADAVRGVRGQGIVADYRGQEVLAVWDYLPSLRWGMMVKIDTAEAFGGIATLQSVAVGVLAFVLLAMLLVSYTLAESLSRPILNLVKATEIVAKGVYENKIAVKGTGEIAQLVDAFDLLIRNTIQQRTKELERMAEQERENSRMRDEFMAVMSHELRTPLNAIIGFMGIVQQRAELDEKNAYRVSRARINAERLLGLINDILDISRIEAGRVQVFKRPMDVAGFFDRLEAQTQSLAEQKSLGFSITIAPDVPKILVTDEELLTKIFINLVGNAFKFTDEGEVTITVTRDGETWSACVKDTGVGIPYHMQEIVFERFRQIDSSPKRRHGGTGLGLSIVSNLTHILQGKVKLESAPNQGSAFTVTFPIELTTEEATPPASMTASTADETDEKKEGTQDDLA